MAITRRDFLKLAGILAAGSAAGCSPLAGYLPAGATDRNPGEFPPPAYWQALSRLTYGPTPAVWSRVSRIGLAAWIEEQLTPEKIADPWTNLLVSRFEILDQDANQLRARGDQLFDNTDPGRILVDFRRATLLRQTYSKRQLYEQIVEFWTDHFNISVEKGDCWYLKVVDDREVIRRHALGNFRDLLGASAHSPAMLVYLDNQANLREAPNENYARELLELHTLGVHGGYTQHDVMELARCLTGWTVKEHFWLGEITFEPAQHAPGSKTVLSRTIPPLGDGELDRVLDHLAVHPSTARTIAEKLARRFLADRPSPELVSRAADAFIASGGEITAVLRVVLLDGLVQHPADYMGPKYKRPLNYVLSALRQTGSDTNGGPPIQTALARMGQPLYGWPTPDGYPDTASAWQGNLLPRWTFALDLVEDRLQGTKFDLPVFLSGFQAEDPPALAGAISQHLLGGQLPGDIQAALLDIFRELYRKDPSKAAGMLVAALLSSPQFQWK